MSKYLPADHTFVVCAYGESPFLEACVASLLNQTVKTRVIIASSTPNAHVQSVAERYEISLYVNEGDPSISHDWNCAVAHCHTSLVTIAHQDDVYLPEFAESVIEAFNQSGHPLIAFTNYGELRNEKSMDESRLLAIKRILLRPLLCRVFKGSIFVRRRILSLGSSICCPSVTYVVPNLPSPLFLDDMKCDLDWEAWERFSRLKGEFLYVPHILMRHRIHEESETTALIEDDTRSKEDLEMLKKFWPGAFARLVHKAYITSQTSNRI